MICVLFLKTTLSNKMFGSDSHRILTYPTPRIGEALTLFRGLTQPRSKSIFALN
jgi:hypothetical protein